MQHKLPIAACCGIHECAAQLFRRARVCAGGRVVFDGPAWNKCTISVISAARAHILCVMLESYEDMLKSACAAPAANVDVLEQLGALWGVEMILRNMGGVLQSGVLQPSEVCDPAFYCYDCFYQPKGYTEAKLLPRHCPIPLDPRLLSLRLAFVPSVQHTVLLHCDTCSCTNCDSLDRTADGLMDR